MNTEITDNIKGWVFYDGECPFCLGWVARSHGILLRRGYHLVPLQAVWARAQLGLNENDPLAEMKLLKAKGRIFGGADAIVQITAGIWWAWPFFMVAQIPGVKFCLRKGYKWLAARRYCEGKCGIIVKRPAKPHHHGASVFYEFP